MLYFPQLLSGSVSQYPLKQTRRARTVVNELSDGHTTKIGDPDFEKIEWDLRLSFLNDQEMDAVETLFGQAEGGLGTFTFLDPGDNLVVWSESLTETVWQTGPLLQLTDNVADPFGENRATRLFNAAQTAQDLSQTLDVPAGFHYSFSAYVRSDQATTIQLKRVAGAASGAEAVQTTSSWQRVFSSSNLDGSEESVSFGIEVPSGAVVEVFGVQVEAQLAPSAYKRTTMRGGVHSRARFLEDSLTITTSGPGLHSVELRLGSTYRN